MRTFFFFPPLPKISGGMAVILQLARGLSEHGHHVELVVREPLKDSDVACNLPVVHWDDLSLTAEDVWVVPEGWPHALSPGLAAKALCVVYVQNWAFLHGHLPQNVTWQQLEVHFLAVSQPVAWFVEQTIGHVPPIVRPSLDQNIFFAPPNRKTISEQETVRIAWMPRKNKALALQVRTLFEARNPKAQVEWLSIHGKEPHEVADILRTAEVFLATGFPEGFGLPPLEAMACGCLVVGFSGLGAWDYFKQALPATLGYGMVPWAPVREDVSWGPNVFAVADADTLAACMALEYAVQVLREDGEKLAAIRHAGRCTANAYNVLQQKEQVLAVWQEYERAQQHRGVLGLNVAR